MSACIRSVCAVVNWVCHVCYGVGGRRELGHRVVDGHALLRDEVERRAQRLSYPLPPGTCSRAAGIVGDQVIQRAKDAVRSRAQEDLAARHIQLDLLSVGRLEVVHVLSRRCRW